MASRKQQILCELLHSGLVSLRLTCGMGEKLSWWSLLRNREIFRIGWEEANFLHNVPQSILEAEFLENDLGFINFDFPAHVKRLGTRLSRQKASLMIEFYDLVPQHLRGKVTWRPSEELKRFAGETGAAPGRD